MEVKEKTMIEEGVSSWKLSSIQQSATTSDPMPTSFSPSPPPQIVSVAELQERSRLAPTQNNPPLPVIDLSSREEGSDGIESLDDIEVDDEDEITFVGIDDDVVYQGESGPRNRRFGRSLEGLVAGAFSFVICKFITCFNSSPLLWATVRYSSQ